MLDKCCRKTFHKLECNFIEENHIVLHILANYTENVHETSNFPLCEKIYIAVVMCT